MESLNIGDNKENLIEKKFIDFDFELQSMESAEDYLHRLNLSINEINRKNDEVYISKRGKRSFNLTKRDYYREFNKKEFDSSYQRAFSVLSKSDFENVKLNKEKNKTVLSELEFNRSARTYNDNMGGSHIKDQYDSINYFNKTNQVRSFFPSQFKKDSFPYALSLFEVPNINSPEAKEYLKRKLDNKRVCLLGGGKSMQDLIESDFVKPEIVVNVDPFLDKEEINKNINNNYRSLEIRSDDPDLFNRLSREGLDKFDEIWASYSVPFYNTTKEQIENLFNNIDKILSEGGNCRITPLNTQNEECVAEINRKLKEMNDMGKYNFDLLDDTLIIHKLKTETKKEKEVDQNVADQQRINDLKNELGI